MQLPHFYNKLIIEDALWLGSTPYHDVGVTVYIGKEHSPTQLKYGFKYPIARCLCLLYRAIGIGGIFVDTRPSYRNCVPQTLITDEQTNKGN